MSKSIKNLKIMKLSEISGIFNILYDTKKLQGNKLLFVVVYNKMFGFKKKLEVTRKEKVLELVGLTFG